MNFPHTYMLLGQLISWRYYDQKAFCSFTLKYDSFPSCPSFPLRQAPMGTHILFKRFLAEYTTQWYIERAG